MNKKLVKQIAFVVSIILFLAIVLFIILRYQRTGETKLPFKVDKILIVSTVDAEKIDDPNNMWNIPVDQVNDVYIYISRDPAEKSNKTINEIRFENFDITQDPKKGKVVLYKATGDINTGDLYLNSSEDCLNKGLTFIGGEIDDMKNLEIANIGGVCGYRFAIKDLGSYVSSEGEEIVYDGSLLSKLGITNGDLAFRVSFDMIITTDNNVGYKGTFECELPAGNIVEAGKGSAEITDFSNVIFKRI